MNVTVNSLATPTVKLSVPSSSTYGVAVTLAATVSGSGGTPTGTVTFYNGNSALETVKLSGGEAKFTTNSLAAGTYIVSATYNGDATFGTASSATTDTLVIHPATATIRLGSLTQTYTGTPLSVTATTVPAGQTVAITYNGSATAPTNAASYAVSWGLQHSCGRQLHRLGDGHFHDQASHSNHPLRHYR